MEKSEIIAGLLDLGRKARKDYLENNNEEAHKINEIVMGAASLIGGRGAASMPTPECFEPDDNALLTELRKMIERREKTFKRDPFADTMLKAMVGPLAFAIPKADQEVREEAATLTAAHNRILALLSEEKAKAEPTAEVKK